MSDAPAAVLGVDGGNSKTELLLASREGHVLGFARGATISHQALAAEMRGSPAQRAAEGARRLAQLARQAASEADLHAVGPFAEDGIFCLAGADFPSDLRVLQAAFGTIGLVRRATVLNDAFAALRAGTEARFGVVVICGAGVNAAGIGRDGRTARFPAVGEISGDWGGSHALGMAALTAALRARDGRGASTALAELVPRHFGVGRPATLTRLLYEGRLRSGRLRELAPLVFETAMDGDAVARGIADRLADELAVMATAIARRVHLLRSSFEVVLAGGVFQTPDAAFFDRIRQQVEQQARRARLVRLEAPPVLGAALLGLDRIGQSSSDAGARLRAELRERTA